MRRFLVSAIFLFALNCAAGQVYTQAVGIRATWHSPGIEYRYYINDMNSLKVLLATRDRGLQLHGFAEFYQYDLFLFSQQLIFFYGFGAHLGFESWDEERYRQNQTWYDTKTSMFTGIDGLIGLEYVFYEAPLIAGIEVKPYFDLFGRKKFDVQLLDFALTLKYLF